MKVLISGKTAGALFGFSPWHEISFFVLFKKNFAFF